MNIEIIHIIQYNTDSKVASRPFAPTNKYIQIDKGD